MRSILAAACIAAVVGLAPFAANAAPISYELPEETASLKPGPDAELAQNNCMACHSVDYITTQPRGPGFQKEFWTAEVDKMIKVYGAPIDADDARRIIDYLAATY